MTQKGVDMLQNQPNNQHIIVYKLLVLDRNTWNHIIVYWL